ncbi:MAG: putative transport system permease protein [Acidobacteriota bacterium]|nr:putative transport system permease protein [Acidobacteriota bacterium]
MWQDIRYGVRILLKSPVFTAVAILALGLGVGANTAIFSIVNSILLRPLSYENPERLVMVWEMNAKRGGEIPTSFLNFADLRDANKGLEGLGAFADGTFNLTGGSEPEKVTGVRVTAPLFSVLGARALKGRVFLPEEDQPAAAPALILSHGLWQRSFGANPNLVGQTVALNGESYTVVGVMPPGFRFPPSFTATIASSQFTMAQADLWVPLKPDEVTKAREARNLLMVGRLKPGVEPEQAEAELSVVAKRLQTEYPVVDADMGVRVTPLQKQVTGDIRLALIVLFGAVGCVLLIACANVANLLLAKAAGRQKEIAVRLALGASRMRVIRQLLTESVLLGVASGLLGLLLAAWGIRQLIALTPPSLSRLNDVSIDGRVLFFTLVVSLVTSLVFGLAPALQASKSDLHETLKEGGRSNAAGRKQNRLRSLLVISEVALALVLLIASGLMLKSFVRLQSVDPGFDPSNLITLELQLPTNSYGEKHQQLAFQQQLVERVGAIPGVRRAAAVDNLPFSGNEINNSFTVEGRPVTNVNERPRLFQRSVSPGYFLTMGIPFRAGRPFAAGDDADAAPVAIINETAAHLLWPNEDALGKRMKKGKPDSKNPWVTVVGIVGGVSHTALGVSAQPEVYFPFPQSPSQTVTLVARTATDPKNFAAPVRREVGALDRGLPVSSIKFMDEILSGSVAQPRLYTLLIAIFAGLALLLAAIGIYGVMSYAVTQRTQEIGIRMALGAQPRDVLKLIVKQGMFLSLTAIVVGLVISFALMRVLSSLLYGVSTTDPLTFVGVPLLLAAVTALACYVPARKATKVDPLVAMRYE